MIRPATAVLALAAVLASCADAALEPEAQFRLESERLYFLCDWAGRPPRVSPVVVDLRLHSANGNRVPTANDVSAVEAAGGRVVRPFSVAVLRASLDTGAVRRLIRGPGAIADYAYAVPDLADTRFEMQVFYSRPPTAADEAALRAAGGEDVSVGVGAWFLRARLRDEAAAAVRVLPGVDFVRAQAAFCGTLG